MPAALAGLMLAAAGGAAALLLAGDRPAAGDPSPVARDFMLAGPAGLATTLDRLDGMTALGSVVPLGAGSVVRVTAEGDSPAGRPYVRAFVLEAAGPETAPGASGYLDRRAFDQVAAPAP